MLNTWLLNLSMFLHVMWSDHFSYHTTIEFHRISKDYTVLLHCTLLLHPLYYCTHCTTVLYSTTAPTVLKHCTTTLYSTTAPTVLLYSTHLWQLLPIHPLGCMYTSCSVFRIITWYNNHWKTFHVLGDSYSVLHIVCLSSNSWLFSEKESKIGF